MLLCRVGVLMWLNRVSWGRTCINCPAAVPPHPWHRPPCQSTHLVRSLWQPMLSSPKQGEQWTALAAAVAAAAAMAPCRLGCGTVLEGCDRARWTQWWPKHPCSLGTSSAWQRFLLCLRWLGSPTLALLLWPCLLLCPPSFFHPLSHYYFLFLRQGFPVAIEPVLELIL